MDLLDDQDIELLANFTATAELLCSRGRLFLKQFVKDLVLTRAVNQGRQGPPQGVLIAGPFSRVIFCSRGAGVVS